MKLVLAFCVLPFAAPFVPTTKHVATTELAALSRREALLTIGSGVMLSAPIANAGTANPFLEEEVNFEPSQMAKSDKVCPVLCCATLSALFFFLLHLKRECYTVIRLTSTEHLSLITKAYQDFTRMLLVR